MTLLFACSDEEPPITSTGESALVAASLVASPTTPVFERVQSRVAGEPTGHLNFELLVSNTGTQAAIIDRAELAYTGAPALSPMIPRDALRRFYLTGCPRTGFGADKSGSLSLDLPAFTIEGIRDVATATANTFLAVTGSRIESFGALGNHPVDNFVVAKLDGGTDLAWELVVPFLGFEDRANALVLADGGGGHVVVGGTHAISTLPNRTYNQPWRFAAVQVDTAGAIVMRPDNTPWKRDIAFSGCSAEAVDVERVYLTSGTFYGYFIAGEATCGTDQRIAVAMLDPNGNLMPAFNGGAFTIDPGVLPAKVGGVAVDPVTSELYIVGAYGDKLMVANLTLGGVLDAGFGAGGYSVMNMPGHDQVMAWDLKVMSNRRLVIAMSARSTSLLRSELGMARLLPTGAADTSLAGTGYVAVSVPGMRQAYGRDIELHDGETWFTITGYAESQLERRIVAAAFAANGSLRTQFDRDGFLVAGPTESAYGVRSSIAGDYITVAGSHGAVLGGARFHRKDGTPDDPTVLGVGESCALLWPDTGKLPSGASHPINAWSFDTLPTGASATLQLLPYGSGVAATATWSGALEAPTVAYKFPGRAPPQTDTYWKISGAHEVMDPHRRAVTWSSVTNALVATQRYAYDVVMVRWTGSKWTQALAGSDGDQNNERIVHGRAVYPIAPGVIVRCNSGVPENAKPGVKDVANTCDPSGVPCFYAGAGNSFRIQHADGSTSMYAHLQNNLSPALCPYTNGGGPTPPIPVTTNTLLGVVGNSGNSSNPHLHVELSAPWDALDPAKVAADYADGRPLLFYNVFGHEASLTPSEFPSLPPFPEAGQWSETLLRIAPPSGGGGGGETTCEEVFTGSPTIEARQADGDAGPDLYCPGDDSVCIANNNGTSECRTCAAGQMYPGCPCSSDDQCGADMTCWGDELPNGALYAPSGLCYPIDALPAWSCGYDCRANFGNQAWCNNGFASLSGRARCMDATTENITLETCWGQGMPAYADDCIVECTEDAQCDGWNYPTEYECDFDDGLPVCRIPL